MKKSLMLLCLVMMSAAMVFAAEESFDQTTTQQSQLEAKRSLDLKLRLEALEQQIFDAKQVGSVSAQLMATYETVLNEMGRTTPARDALDQGGDDCTDAVDLGSALGEAIATGSTSNFDNDFVHAVAPPCYQGTNFDASANGPDVTYKWTAPQSGIYTFSLCGSSYDTEISLWNFTCPSFPSYPSDYICGNDDAEDECASSGLHSKLECIPLATGQEVLIVVDGWSTRNGNYVLSVIDCNAPVECFDREMSAPGTIEGTTCNAGNDCDFRSSPEVVVAVNIPHSGAWTFEYNESDSNFDPYLYIGTECCSNDICQDNDGGPGDDALCECVILPAGVVYVTLEGVSGSCGEFTLTVSEAGCSYGRCCYTSDLAGPSCATLSLEECALLGGAWDEGLNCDENPCSMGRCCYYDDAEAICVQTREDECLFELSGRWSEGLTCEEACPEPGDCGPIDLVFAVDITGSMQSAIDNIIAELPSIVAYANAASDGDLRLGLVTFKDDVRTLHNLTVDVAAVEASIGGLSASGGEGFPEASDEALREIITNDALCTNGSEFTTPFRAAATKIIVLITDASNGGCNDNHNATDVANAHQRALDAAGLGIRISSVYVPNPSNEAPAIILPVLNDYAATSAGSVRIVASDGAGTGGAIYNILSDCGQGELRLSSLGVDLRCDPNGGGITTPTFNLRVTTLNDGTAECLNASLEITSITGDFGTAVINSTNPVALGNLAINQTIHTDFNITITPDADGGTMTVRADITSDNCPTNFLEIVITVPECETCVGDTVINIFEDNSDIPPPCLCAYLCEGSPARIVVCGSGFFPGRYPLLLISSGCITDGCEEQCDPAEFIFSDTGWILETDTITGEQCWYNWIFPQSDGCVCICFDRFLPVELSSFTALSRDGEIQINWSTSSETNNDHFELLRDGLMTAHVAATNNATGSTYSFVDRNLDNGRAYHYELVSVSMNGERASVGELNAVPQAGAAVVTELALHQNFPNPFNPQTNISFDLVESGNVTLTIYNAVGQEVAMLLNGQMNTGRHTVVFDADGLPSGLYFYRLTAGENTMQKKMLLLK